jgi:PPOX class probable F420-dependent enzyme
MPVPEAAAHLLTSEPLMAHLATCREGRPHVAPVWYWYDADEQCVELVTTGRKLANIRANPRVALSVQKDESGHARWMVTLLGTADVVDDEAATRDATRRINAKYGASEDAWSENRLVRVRVGTASYRTYD